MRDYDFGYYLVKNTDLEDSKTIAEKNDADAIMIDLYNLNDIGVENLPLTSYTLVIVNRNKIDRTWLKFGLKVTSYSALCMINF